MYSLINFFKNSLSIIHFPVVVDVGLWSILFDLVFLCDLWPGLKETVTVAVSIDHFRATSSTAERIVRDKYFIYQSTNSA